MSDEYSGSDKQTKIFWFGDGACVSTGFGNVAEGVLDGLYKTGKYDIVQLGINYYGDPHNKPYDIFPLRAGDPYGKRRLYEVIIGTNPDVFIANNDIWALGWVAEVLAKARQTLGKPIPLIVYFPIDGLPIKPEWINFIKNQVDIPITYTHWAAEEIKKRDVVSDIEYIYHGVDIERFRPNKDVKMQMRAELSKELKRDINFVIGYVGRNQPRKRLPELLLAYKEFSKDKNDTLLYLHTPVIDKGWNLKGVKETLGISDGQVLITPKLRPAQGVAINKLADLYSFFDVLCLPTVGEGFGLPLIEGMSSGCPIVSSNCSVVPEIVGDAGILVDPAYIQISPNDNELLRPIPSPVGMAAAFNTLYANKDIYNAFANRGIERAKTFKDWSIPKWEDAIERALAIIDNRAKGGLDFDLDVFEEI